MEYILRVAVHEDAWRRQLTELLSLFERTPIREVMLMEESHKILMSAFPREKHLRMAAIYNEMARAFEKAGIRFSINLVTCVGHGDNAVPERLRLPFTRFTGEELEPSNAVYCISDAAWVEYTAGICALYAKTKPTRLMLDDDFRSLNHTSRYGCFCENHVRMTSERLGFPVTKEQLRDAVCGIGSDAEKIKAAWLKVNFEVQLHAAKEIERAIHTVSPKTQVGLMNSGEPAHSIQGRDMNELLRAFAGEGQCLSRPLGGAYSDVLHRGIPAMISGMSLSMAAVEEDTCWVSEVENYPNSLYNKSIALTKLQLQLHTLAGADALTLNLYDYLATPLPLQEEYARAVREADSSVQTLAQLRSGKHMRGVGLPWRKDAAEHRRNLSRTLDGAMPKRPLDDILPLLGIPVQFAALDCGASARCACNAVQYSLFADGARRHVCRLCPLRVVCRHWFLACRVCDGGDIADTGILVLAPRNAPTCSWGCPFKDKRQRPEREAGIFAPPGAPARANMSCSRSERPCQGWYADLDAVLSFR